MEEKKLDKNIKYDKKLNVLFVTPNFYPKIGGVVVHSYNVIKELENFNVNVKVLTNSFFGNEPKRIFYDNIEVFRIPKTRSVVLKNFFMLKYFFLFKNSDVIHFHDPTSFFSSFFLRILFFWKKYIITFHGYEGSDPSFFLKFIRKISRFFCSKSVCIGDFISKWYGNVCDFFSYGGVDKKFFFNNDKSFSEKINFLFLGRLEKDTEVEKYLFLLKSLKEDNNFKFDINLTVLGDGSLKDFVLNFCKENDINLDFVGFSNNVDFYLKKSHVLFSSGYLSILEGLASKNIVVSFYSESIKKDYLSMSIFKNNIVFSDSVDEVKFKLLEIFNDKKLYSKYVSEGFVLAKENSWKKVAKLYYDIYVKK